MRPRRILRLSSCGVLLCCSAFAQQARPPQQQPPAFPTATRANPQATQAAPPAPAVTPVVALYRELRTVGLDPAKVYTIRDVSLDRGAIHLSFTDGVIAFTRAVDGHITGAFFAGEGEMLVIPPTRVERASLALFTRAATLDDTFTTAYLRFDDDTYQALLPNLNAVDNPQDFISRWNASAQALAESDALRLLTLFTRAGQPPSDTTRDRYLHIRVASLTLGTYDVFLDTRSPEQVSVGQVNHSEAGTFYDLWTSFAMSGQQGAATDPEANHESAESRLLRVSRYTIRARVRPPHELQSEAELAVELLQGGWRVIVFELSRYLRVSSVTMQLNAQSPPVPLEIIQNEAVAGTELARRGNDVVAVVFPNPPAAGTKLTLKFNYEGDVLSEAGGGLMYVGARGIWYPNLGLNMADYDVEFRYPPQWTLIATGRRTSMTTNGPEVVAHYVSDHPLPVAGFNLGEYVHASAKASDTVVDTYAARGVEASFPVQQPQVVPSLRQRQQRAEVVAPPPPVPAAHITDVARNSAQLIDWLAPRIGAFPYATLSLTQRPGPDSQGWPGLVFLSSYTYVAEDETVRARWNDWERVLFGRLMQAHETAHQWWGDCVNWDSYRDQWLAEALANYSALMYIEEQDPPAFHIAMDHLKQLLLEKRGGEPVQEAGPVTLGMRLSSSRFPDGYDAVTYGRGTWLIHMLRHIWRDAALSANGSEANAPADPDAAFFAVLRGLVERFRYKQMSTLDVQRAFEAALPANARYEGKKSLDWFFDGWVNGAAIPHFELADVRFTNANGKAQVTGKLRQKDAPNDLVTSVPIYGVAAPGMKPVLLGRVFADGPETTFRLSAPASAKKLIIDPMQTVLSK